MERKQWLGWNELPEPQAGNTGDYKEIQEFLFNLVKEYKPKNILEIGFNAGHSACCFLNASPKSKMYTFDICGHGTEKKAWEVLKRHFDINLIEGNSLDTIPSFFKSNKDFKFDLVFVDGYHGFDVTLNKMIPYEDIKNTIDYVNDGGLIILDDYELIDVAKSSKRFDWKEKGFREFEETVFEDVTRRVRGVKVGTTLKKLQIIKKINRS